MALWGGLTWGARATNVTLLWLTLLCHPGGRGRPSCPCGGPLHR